jgi:hypothetical protein
LKAGAVFCCAMADLRGLQGRAREARAREA